MEVVTLVAPLPSPEGPDRPEKRVTLAAIVDEKTSQLLEHVDVFYTDVARDDSHRTTIARLLLQATNRTTSLRHVHEAPDGKTSGYSVRSGNGHDHATPRNHGKARIHRLQKGTVLSLQHSSTCKIAVAHIGEQVSLARAKQKIAIAWIPGYANIPENKRADGTARALLQAGIQPSQGPFSSPVQRDVSTKEVFGL